MKSLFPFIHKCVLALCLFCCPIIAHAETYEVSMHQIEPKGASITATCVSDQEIEAPCAKTLDLPVSINGKDKIVEVAIIIKPSSNQILAEFVLEGRYFLSTSGIYYSRYEGHSRLRQSNISTVWLFALADKNAKIPFKSHPVIRERTDPLVKIEVSARRYKDK